MSGPPRRRSGPRRSGRDRRPPRRSPLDGARLTAFDVLDGVSLAPRIEPADARVEWALPAHVIDRRVRGVTPAPGAWTTWRGDRLRLGPVRPSGDSLAPGELRVDGGSVQVGTGGGAVVLGDVQPAGKRMLPAADWARGARPRPGDRLGG